MSHSVCIWATGIATDHITIAILGIIHRPAFYIYIYIYIYREREREREKERRESWKGGNQNNNFAVLRVPRQCPLVLLVEARFVFWICSILILKMLERLYWVKCSMILGGLY
jgi:hypothetical protein